MANELVKGKEHNLTIQTFPFRYQDNLNQRPALRPAARLGSYRVLDFRHSELLPVSTQLSPYYTVKFTGFSNTNDI